MTTSVAMKNTRWYDIGLETDAEWQDISKKNLEAMDKGLAPDLSKELRALLI